MQATCAIYKSFFFEGWGKKGLSTLTCICFFLEHNKYLVVVNTSSVKKSELFNQFSNIYGYHRSILKCCSLIQCVECM